MVYFVTKSIPVSTIGIDIVTSSKIQVSTSIAKSIIFPACIIISLKPQVCQCKNFQQDEKNKKQELEILSGPNTIGYTQQQNRNAELDFLSLKIQELDCQQICQKIQNLIDQYTRSGKVIDNSFLDIRISNVACTIEPELQKLENVNISES